jgi:ArsR family transcriptional regulator
MSLYTPSLEACQCGDGTNLGELTTVNESTTGPIDASVLERASRVIRVVGHPLRLRLLELLESGEHNVTQLVRGTGVGQAIVSQQLRILRAEGVVGARRDGARVYYWITEPKVSKILDCIRECDLPDLLDASPPAASPAGSLGGSAAGRAFPSGPTLRIVDARPARQSTRRRSERPAGS